MAIIPKIAAVSYLNTIPFIYGIENEGNITAELLLTPPNECTQNYLDGVVDIALLPSAVVPTLTDAEVITDFCIGAEGEVRSVVIVSDDPIEDITTIYLDPHSQTSVQLAGYLAQNYWHIAPEWRVLDDYSRINRAEDGEAFLLIGDKVFEHEEEFEYSYDLSEIWADATGLPFAFAVWVARKGTPIETIDALNHALEFGVEHTYEAILEYRADGSEVESHEYLTRNIDFLLDGAKRKSLEKFWASGIRIEPKRNPG
ncbi:MAG: menaquinone biosynthesis protein [Rikenellaceae bacterium]